MIKIIIADDHKMVVDGLKSILETDHFSQIISTAANGQELLHLLSLVEPDLVLMDIDMPVMNGLVAMQEIKRLYPNVKVIVLTMHEEGALVKKMIDMGAKGFLFKNSDKGELFTAVETVVNGGSYISSDLIYHPAKDQKLNHEEGNSPFLGTILTDREVEILRLIASGLSNKEIGDKLFISHRTVDTHRTNIMKKLEVNNIAGLIRYAIRNGFMS
ncbi:MAG: response regulator transcription factor [Bacteroidales bacterium]|nr:response regulator transcription factor [Bacteroidales bacterium]